ncbi:(2Fe-2S)-binding protein [Opitutia bacterium ISCC 51]|nr:(2Fe-2S)-binding protein [Opitutae bacterium ISCC 51]QXD29509.1 (2Fe-2S)-binding protein [Opitutae bacterium ISCC 52]
MANYTLSINGSQQSVDADPSMPLLWVLRDLLNMTGTKYSCGIGQCGACTIHLNGAPIRSCTFPVSGAVGQSITTIEGIAVAGGQSVQEAWKEEDVPQCGYCQAGQIMSATALLKSNSNPTDEDIDAAMTGNICRCGTYKRIRKAIHLAAEKGGAA